MNSGIPPALRGGVQGEETELDVVQDVGRVSTRDDIEEGGIEGVIVPVGTWRQEHWDGEGIYGQDEAAYAHLGGWGARRGGEGAVEDGDSGREGIAEQRVTVSEADGSAGDGADAADRMQLPVLLPSEVPDARDVGGDDASQGDMQGGGQAVLSGETRGLESPEASPALSVRMHSS